MIHIIDTVLTIPIDVATTAREVPALSGFLPLLIEPPPDPALVGIAGPEKDWTLYVRRTYPILKLLLANAN